MTAPLGALHGLTLETGILFLPTLVFYSFQKFLALVPSCIPAHKLTCMLVGAGLVRVLLIDVCLGC